MYLIFSYLQKSVICTYIYTQICLYIYLIIIHLILLLLQIYYIMTYDDRVYKWIYYYTIYIIYYLSVCMYNVSRVFSTALTTLYVVVVVSSYYVLTHSLTHSLETIYFNSLRYVIRTHSHAILMFAKLIHTYIYKHVITRNRQTMM